MKHLLLILLVAQTFSVNAQNTTKTYLMYQRINAQSIDRFTNKVTEFTQFMVEGIMTLADSKAYTRSLISYKVAKKVNWEVNSTGDNIKISNQEWQLNGLIITNPFIDSVLFNNQEVKFLLLPIESGVSLKPLNGRYTELGGLNLGSIFVFGEIINEGNYKGSQKTTIEGHPGEVWEITTYKGSKYNNLIFLGPMYRFLQPLSVDSNSVITFNTFLEQFDKPAMIKSVIKLHRLQ